MVFCVESEVLQILLGYERYSARCCCDRTNIDSTHCEGAQVDNDVYADAALSTVAQVIFFSVEVLVEWPTGMIYNIY